MNVINNAFIFKYYIFLEYIISFKPGGAIGVNLLFLLAISIISSEFYNFLVFLLSDLESSFLLTKAKIVRRIIFKSSAIDFFNIS